MSASPQPSMAAVGALPPATGAERSRRAPMAKLALVLGTAASLATLAALPLLLTLTPAEARARLPAVPVLVAFQLGQGLLLYTALAWLGLRLGAGVGLGAPLLRHWLYGEQHAVPRRAWREALLGGAMVYAMVLAVAGVMAPLLPKAMLATSPTPWQGLGASFYGGITEEVLMRAFLLSTLAWLALKLARGRIAARHAVAVAIVLSAILFGVGHLPIASQVVPLDAYVVTYVILGNSLGGLVFGWLYARHGLEMAILAHFGTDLLLYVATPLVQSAP
jgi:membrane protease YdiL (CAAX protease family)